MGNSDGKGGGGGGTKEKIFQGKYEAKVEISGVLGGSEPKIKSSLGEV